ncbi:TMEM175 family protein [Microbacterium sp. RD1]|uniref:TMEM175 family protein n=1 Tax=Microbacterium sp. RD1 TaxID=3457313 RepID=UPI003FA5FC94
MPNAREPEGAAASGRGPAVTAPVGSDEYGRGISFFDAVYGFAITLLIANVDPPSAEEWTSIPALASSGLGTQLLGLALSFTVIAVFWRVNVQMMRMLRGIDGPTVAANLVAVGMILLIPFTTQGISDPQSNDLPLPTALYALNIALAALAQTAVAQIGRARGLERSPTTARENRRSVLGALATPAVFLASVPVALLAGAEPAKWTWAGLLVLGPLWARLLARR